VTRLEFVVDYLGGMDNSESMTAYLAELHELSVGEGEHRAFSDLLSEIQMLRSRIRYLEGELAEFEYLVEARGEELLLGDVDEESLEDSDGSLGHAIWDGSDPIEYADWLLRNEIVDHAAVRQFVTRRGVDVHLTMLLTVVCSDNIELVERSLAALQHQIYSDWDAVVILEFGCAFEVVDRIDRLVAVEPRFSLIVANEGVFGPSLVNAGLAKAVGCFVGWMRPGDAVRSDALAWYAVEIAEAPDVAVVYSDHDYLSEVGRRQDPCFKPDWNPELLICSNYISRAVMFSRDCLERVGGLRSECHIMPEWDVVLRLSRIVAPSQIRHIPAVLYHLVASDPGSDVTALDEARFIQDSYLSGSGLSYELVDQPGIQSGLPVFAVVGNPRVAIIIPTRDGLDDLRTCIASVRSTSYDNYEIVVVNNQSSDPATLAYFEEMSSNGHGRVLDYPFPFSYADLHNYAVSLVDADYLCLLNNDTQIVDPDWLSVMVGYAQLDGVGAVGAKLLYPSGQVQHAGVVLGPGGLVAHVNRLREDDAGGYMDRALLVQDFSAVTAACMVVRRSHWEQVGGMSERLPIAYNDVDFCLRLYEAGFRNVYLPHVKIIHHESKSRGKDSTHSQQYRSMRESGYLQWRWGHLLKRDPAYNANLSLFDEHWRLGVARTSPPWSPQFDWIRLPDGFNDAGIKRAHVFSGQEFRFVCRVPLLLTGHVGALRFAVDEVVGELDGIAVLRVSKDGHEAVSVQPLDGLRKRTVIIFEFDNGQLFEVAGGETLECTFTLHRAMFPVGLPTYPSSSDWSQDLDGFPDRALHVEAGLLMLSHVGSGMVGY
jgi:GT2 family glycosyltransferase